MLPVIAQVQITEPEAPTIDAPSIGELWQGFLKYWREFNWSDFWQRILVHVQSAAFWIDLGIVVACLLLAAVIVRYCRKREGFRSWEPVAFVRQRYGVDRKFPALLAVAVPLLWLAVVLTGQADSPCPILRTTTLILTAYLAILLSTALAKDRFWVKPLVTVLILTAVLHMLGWREWVVNELESIGIGFGEVRITLLSLIVGPMAFLVAYGIGGLLTGYAERHMARSKTMPPSVSVLAGKLMQFGMVVIAIVITLSAVGINLTALTVFGGALGLGIGFGLQKVISNLFSGIILLLDKSIKPGDVIEISGTYGRINGLRTRYASVVTRDNKEFLIPNEDLITQPVVNWSFSDRFVRLRAPLGISYGSDVRLAIQLCEEAATKQPRVVEDPAARCLLRGFGDSSIDLEIRFWITDPMEGCGNITSAVLLSVWDAFKEHGVEIPFPQRDLHVKSGGEVIREIVSAENPDPD